MAIIPVLLLAFVAAVLIAAARVSTTQAAAARRRRNQRREPLTLGEASEANADPLSPGETEANEEIETPTPAE
jgi:hypothetical protein